MERQLTQIGLYHMVLPVLNIKYCIVGKYFPETNWINVSWQTHKFRKVVQLLHHFAIQLLEVRGMIYLQKGEIYQSQWKINKNLPKLGGLYFSIYKCPNSNGLLHKDRNEETGAACKNIFFHLLFMLRCSSLQESILNLSSTENSTTSKQLKPPNILIFLIWKY